MLGRGEGFYDHEGVWIATFKCPECRHRCRVEDAAAEETPEGMVLYCPQCRKDEQEALPERTEAGR